MEFASVSQAEEQRWSFEERLRQYPALRERMETLLAVVENAAGDVVRADEAEQRVLEEIRQMGHEALQAWAERKRARVEAEHDQRRDLSHKTKKNSPGRRALGRSR
jgi:hypothetical protein